MTISEAGAIIAPVLGLIGVYIASRLSSKSAKDGILMEGYDELVTHLREDQVGLRERAERAERSHRESEAERRKLQAELYEREDEIARLKASLDRCRGEIERYRNRGDS